MASAVHSALMGSCVHGSGSTYTRILSSTFTGTSLSIHSPCFSFGKEKGKCKLVTAKIREIFMPALSSTMTEGKIVSWIKNEGEKLSKGESVVVVESDKADMDVETFYDGYLASIVVGEGEVAPVGAAIALLAETQEEIAEAKAQNIKSAVKTPPSPPASVTIDSITPATVSTTSVPVSAPPPPSTEQGERRIIATPYAKKLAKQYKVDLNNLVGSGPYGRIVASDVEIAAGKKPTVSSAVAESPKDLVPAASAVLAKVGSKVVSSDGALIAHNKEVPFTAMQAAVARNMVESLSVPTFRVGYAINTDALDALYKRIKSKGVTMTALLAKAAALALAQHPVINASCKDGKSFAFNDSINIAVAVATDGGLITPVLQDADKVDLYSLSRKWKELVEKARAKQLQPHEYSSGTFTISNLGMFGVDRFDAILPPGSGAIMAVGAARPTVVAVGGLFGVKNQMNVNVTADHRIIYGADLAAFLQTLSKIIEDPKDLTL